MTEAETGKRPKPIELVARAMKASFAERVAEGAGMAFEETSVAMPREESWDRYAKAAFDILIKHGCISIEGIIARDEELARVAPVPERAGET